MAKPKNAVEMPSHLAEKDMSEIDGWYKPAPNNPAHGVLLGADSYIDKATGEVRDFAKIRVKGECLCGTEEEPVELKDGQTMAVGKREKLGFLFDGSQIDREVWFVPTEKKKLASGRTVWLWKVALEPAKRA